MEELLRRAKELNICSEYSLALELHNEAIVVEISHSGKIPLKPHLTGDDVVPDPTAGLDGMELVDLDSLWLHLVKK